MIKIYKDSEFTTIAESLDMGMVSAGSSKAMTYYVKNEYIKGYCKDIEFITNNEDIEIIDAPKSLKSGESAKLVMQWNSNTLEEETLSKLEIKYKRVI